MQNLPWKATEDGKRNENNGIDESTSIQIQTAQAQLLSSESLSNKCLKSAIQTKKRIETYHVN